MWVLMSDPAVVEMAAHAGYDYVNIDMEHTSLDLPTIENMLRAATANGISAFVRVPGNDPKTVLRVAELGPDGIIIPHIRDAQDARQAVLAAKFSPVGDRGAMDISRAADYGARSEDFPAFANALNEHLMIYVQIEDKSAVDDVAAIASVEGIDAVGIGPADLARSLGYLGSHNHPEVGRVIKDVASTVQSVDKAYFGFPLRHGNYSMEVSEILEMGGRMIHYGSDVSALMKGLHSNISSVREGALSTT